VGTIRTVSDDSLVIDASDGQVLTFAWRGPALVTAFAIGESVRLQFPTTGESWSMVRGTRATAATQSSGGGWMLPEMQQVPDGPSLKYSLTCLPFYSVTARLGTSVPVAIPPSQSATIGPWTVTNVYVVRIPPGRVREAAAYVQVTALLRDTLATP
jgi:hypothetical protein